jgi:chorismate dehydratase
MINVGAVSYLNSTPLIDGLEHDDRLHVVTDVPSRLLGGLLAGRVDVALCPVIDYQMSPEPLRVVPVGAICSEGATLTVRVFSREPLNSVRRVWVDGDSHTSVRLLQIVFHHRFGRLPEIEPLEPTGLTADPADLPSAVLLIGDKVVAAEPNTTVYRHQLDLGTAWNKMTGLPFVFATWMTRVGVDIGAAPAHLDRRRRENCRHLDSLADRLAPSRGWPTDLARSYLGRNLHFDLDQRGLESMSLFWSSCKDLGLTDRCRPLVRYDDLPPSLARAGGDR